MPSTGEIRSWKQKSKVVMKGNVAVKVTTRMLRMKDGTEREVVVEENQEIKI